MRSESVDVKNCQTRVNLRIILLDSCGLTPCTSGRNQGSHFSIRRLDGCDQRVGTGSDVCEDVAHLCRLTLHIFGVVVHQRISFPVCCATDFASRAPIFKANKETVEFRVLVPPDHDEMIQFACGAVRTTLADQSSSVRAHSTVRATPPLSPMGPALTGLHGFNVVPVAHECLGYLCHLRNRIEVGS